MNTAPIPATTLRRHRPPSVSGIALAVFTAFAAIGRMRKGRSAEEPIPADFVREAQEITAEDWEPAVPLR